MIMSRLPRPADRARPPTRKPIRRFFRRPYVWLLLAIGSLPVLDATASVRPARMERVSFQTSDHTGIVISGLRSRPSDALVDTRIVVLTGAPAKARSWRKVAALAPANWEFLIIERPGYGKSQNLPGAFSLARQADALALVSLPLRQERLILVGQGVGAQIATVMAARAPERIASLVLVSAFLGDITAPIARQNWLAKPLLLSPVAPKSVATRARELKSLSAAQDGRRDLELVISELKQPVTVIDGEKDRFTPSVQAQYWQDKLPKITDPEFVLIAEGGHDLPDQAPRKIVDALREALIRAGPAKPRLPTRIEGSLGQLPPIYGLPNSR